MRWSVRRCSKTCSSMVGEGSAQTEAYRSAGRSGRRRVSMEARGEEAGSMKKLYLMSSVIQQKQSNLLRGVQMKNKFLIAVVVVTVGVLAACGGQPAQTGASGDSQSQATPISADTAAPAPTVTGPLD